MSDYGQQQRPHLKRCGLHPDHVALNLLTRDFKLNRVPVAQKQQFTSIVPQGKRRNGNLQNDPVKMRCWTAILQRGRST